MGGLENGKGRSKGCCKHLEGARAAVFYKRYEAKRLVGSGNCGNLGRSRKDRGDTDNVVGVKREMLGKNY